MPLDPRQIFPNLGDDYLAVAKADPVQGVADPSITERLAYHTLKSPLTAASGIGSAIKNLLGIPMEQESPELQAEQAIIPGRTTGAKVADFALGGLLPMVEELAVTGGAFRALGGAALAARSPLLGRVAEEAAQFGSLGLQQDVQTGGVEAGVGASLGALKALPLSGRIPLAALLGLGTKEYYDAKHPDESVGGFSAGDIAGSLNTLFGIAGKRVPLRPGAIPDNFAPIAKAAEGGQYATPGRELATLSEQPRFQNGILEEPTGPTIRASGPLQNELPAPRGEVIYQPDSDLFPMQPRLPGPIRPVDDQLTRLTWPGGEARTYSPSGEPIIANGPTPIVEAPVATIANVEEALPKAKGKLRSLPEYQRTQGGFVQGDFATNPIARAAAGAFIGGTAGKIAAPEDNKGAALGAAIGAGAFLAGPTLLRSISEFRSQTPPSGAGGTAVPTKWDYNEAVAKAHLNRARGEGTLVDGALARMDNWFRSTRNDELKRVLQQSHGLANYQLTNMEEALRKASIGFKPEPGLVDATNEFLTGKLDEAGYLQGLQNAPEQAQAYANLMIEARKSMRGLMEQGALAQSSPARAKMMIDTGDEYLRNSYSLFTKGKLPSQEAVDALADKLHATGEWSGQSREGIHDALWEYANEIKKSKGVYKPSSGGSGVKIDQSVFKKRKLGAADQEWKDYLGEITDPTERVRLTLLKLKPMAEAGNFMSKLKDGLKDSKGNPMVFENRTLLEAHRKANPAGGAELNNYQYMPTDYRYGQLGGKMVHRQIADVLDDWESATKVNSSTGRFLIGLNNMMKSNVTYRNPAAIARQLIGAPFFAAIAKANPLHAPETYKALKDYKSGLGKEMIENGIVNADYLSRDVMKEANDVSGGLASLSPSAWLGRADGSIQKGMGMLRSLDRKAADAFRYPDNFVRANAYVSAKYRFAKELGKAIDDPEVINRAVEHTNRYTMNYDLVAPIVKSGRNVPGVSLFLTYTAEITRLMKNLGQDLWQGDASKKLHAAMALGAVAALPEVLQKGSESNLSPEDAKAWEKVKAGLPVYSKHRYKIVTGREKNGSFNFIDFSSIVPIDNYAQVIKSISEGELGDAAKLNPVVGWDNNPVINIVAQNITNKDRYTQRTLRGGADRVGTVTRELFGPFDPISGSLVRSGEQAFATNASGKLGVTDKAGRKLSPSDFFTRLGGFGSGQYNLDAIQRSQVAEAKAEIANELAYLNDVIKSDYSKDKKQAAAERAKIAIDGIHQKLLHQLQP